MAGAAGQVALRELSGSRRLRRFDHEVAVDIVAVERQRQAQNDEVSTVGHRGAAPVMRA